jgi:hypothetical protein
MPAGRPSKLQKTITGIMARLTEIENEVNALKVQGADVNSVLAFIAKLKAAAVAQLSNPANSTDLTPEQQAQIVAALTDFGTVFTPPVTE